jgi:hypothetical protein
VVADVAVVTAVVIVTVALVAAGGPAGRRQTIATTITVDRGAVGRAIPRGFLGLSLEFSSIETYAGRDPLAVDPVLEQLIRNLSPGQSPMLRIGGDSTDWTWWPVSGMSRPPGVTFTLTQNWMQVTRALTRALNARLILGINLEADSLELASAEAQALADGLGTAAVDALELGNEPALYAGFAWYRTRSGKGVPGRLPSYDFDAFVRDFSSVAAVLPRVPLAGPALGTSTWLRRLNDFLNAEPAVRLVTLHRYPLQLCFTPSASPMHPSIAHLLSREASAGLASQLAPYVSLAHARGLALRIDEINTVSCGSDPAVSNTFASALWAIDALFELASIGIDGVNIHTFPGAGYELFRMTHVGDRWRASVAPEYYGLLLFAQATPPGSRIIRVTGARAGVRPWATVAPSGNVHVVLINDAEHLRVVRVRAAPARGSALLERMTGPSAAAANGITLGGQGFGLATETGLPAGAIREESIRAANGSFVVALPAHTAAMLTLPS